MALNTARSYFDAELVANWSALDAYPIIRYEELSFSKVI